MKPSLKNFLDLISFLIPLTLIYYLNPEFFQGTTALCMQSAYELSETKDLTQELLTYGIDILNSFFQQNQNGTHLMRMFSIYSNNAHRLITFQEYQHLKRLSSIHNIDVNLRKTPWHWGVIINEGANSLVTNFTTQPNTFFTGINRRNNIQTYGNLFHYYNTPILIDNNILNSYVEVSNDINFTPRRLINRGLFEIIDNSLSIINDIRFNLWRNRDYEVIHLDGDRFRIGRLDTEVYNNFNNRLYEITHNIV